MITTDQKIRLAYYCYLVFMLIFGILFFAGVSYAQVGFCDYTNLTPLDDANTFVITLTDACAASSTRNTTARDITNLCALNIGIDGSSRPATIHILASGTPITPDADTNFIVQDSVAVGTNNRAVIVSGISGIAELGLGDTANERICALSYDNATNTFDLLVNAISAMKINSSGEIGFSADPISGYGIVIEKSSQNVLITNDDDPLLGSLSVGLEISSTQDTVETADINFTNRLGTVGIIGSLTWGQDTQAVPGSGYDVAARIIGESEDFGNPSGGLLSFYTTLKNSGLFRALHIDRRQNVCIGACTPGAIPPRLQIENEFYHVDADIEIVNVTASGRALITFTNNSGSWVIENSGTLNEFAISDGATKVFVAESGSFANTIYIDSSGSVGVGGTIVPQSVFHVFRSGGTLTLNANTDMVIQDTTVAGSISQFSLIGGTSGNSVINLGNVTDENEGFIDYSHADTSMTIGTDASVALTIDNDDLTVTDDLTISGGALILPTNCSPAQTDACIAGTRCNNASFAYYCIASGNWGRVALDFAW